MSRSCSNFENSTTIPFYQLISSNQGEDITSLMKFIKGDPYLSGRMQHGLGEVPLMGDVFLGGVFYRAGLRIA